MHQWEQHPRYMGSFTDFYVGIRGFVGDMKLILMCFALLTHVALLLCFRHVLVQFDLLGGCWTGWGPPDVANSSPSYISNFSTPRSMFRML